MVSYTVTRKVPYTVKQQTPDGKTEIVTKFTDNTETRYKAVMMKCVVVADGKEVQICRKDGTSVDPKDLLKLLSKEAHVLVFSHGEIDPYYLKVIHDQVLIIVVPPGKDFPGRPKE